MFGEFFEIGCPDRIDRPVRFEVSAYPVEEALACGALGDLGSVVDANHPHPFFVQRVELFQMGHDRMPFSPIGIENDRVGIVERGRIFGPAVAVHDRVHFGHIFIQGHRQQRAAGAVFVGPPRVGITARDEDCFFLARQRQPLEPNVFELHLHGWTDMQLQGEDATLLAEVIDNLRHRDPIDFVDHAVAGGKNGVLIPVLLFDRLLQFGSIAERADDSRLAILANLGLLSATGQCPATPLLVMGTRPGVARFKIRLMAPDDMVPQVR